MDGTIPRWGEILPRVIRGGVCRGRAALAIASTKGNEILAELVSGFLIVSFSTS